MTMHLLIDNYVSFMFNIAQAMGALGENVRVVRNDRERPVYRKDLLPEVYVVADQAGRTDSPLYGMFAARGKVAGQALEEALAAFVEGAWVGVHVRDATVSALQSKRSEAPHQATPQARVSRANGWRPLGAGAKRLGGS